MNMREKLERLAHGAEPFESLTEEMVCNVIVPRQSHIVGVRDDGYLAACIRTSGHPDKHLIKTPEGKFFTWEDDWDCGCCRPDEDDRCYDFEEITEQEAIKLM